MILAAFLVITVLNSGSNSTLPRSVPVLDWFDLVSDCRLDHLEFKLKLNEIYKPPNSNISIVALYIHSLDIKGHSLIATCIPLGFLLHQLANVASQLKL